MWLDFSILLVSAPVSLIKKNYILTGTVYYDQENGYRYFSFTSNTNPSVISKVKRRKKYGTDTYVPIKGQ
jgi:hypothetical protein